MINIFFFVREEFFCLSQGKKFVINRLPFMDTLELIRTNQMTSISTLTINENKKTILIHMILTNINQRTYSYSNKPSYSVVTWTKMCNEIKNSYFYTCKSFFGENYSTFQVRLIYNPLLEPNFRRYIKNDQNFFSTTKKKRFVGDL